MSIEPLLSFCIPTYNRSAFLEKTLSSIVGQPAFLQSDAVEVIVSDNCSSDGTEAVVRDFARRFPEKVRYIRTPRQLPSAHNFAHALQHGRGKLCKLHNDTLLVRPGALEACLEFIRDCLRETPRPLPYFLNGNTRCAEKLTPCSSVEQFIGHSSFYATWIGAFALWREDVPEYTQFFLQKKHHFAQTEILLSSLHHQRYVTVCNTRWGDVQEAPKQVTVNFLNTVYVDEYLTLLVQQVHEGGLSQRAYARELRRFLFFYYIPYYFQLEGRFSFRYVTHFAYTKPYATPFAYAMAVSAYPFYAALHPCLKWPFLQKAVSVLRKILHG